MTAPTSLVRQVSYLLEHCLLQNPLSADYFFSSRPHSQQGQGRASYIVLPNSKAYALLLPDPFLGRVDDLTYIHQMNQKAGCSFKYIGSGFSVDHTSTGRYKWKKKLVKASSAGSNYLREMAGSLEAKHQDHSQKCVACYQDALNKTDQHVLKPKQQQRQTLGRTDSQFISEETESKTELSLLRGAHGVVQK